MATHDCEPGTSGHRQAVSKPVIERALEAGLAAAALLLWFHLSGWVLPAGMAARHWPAAMGLLVLASVARTSGWCRWDATLVLLCLAFVVAGSGTPLARVAFALAVVIALPTWSMGSLVPLAWSLCSLVALHVPWFEWGAERLALEISSGLPGDPLTAGPTPLAMGPFAVALGALMVEVFRRRGVAAASAAVVLPATLFIWHLTTFHTVSKPSWSSAGEAFDRLPWSALALACVGALGLLLPQRMGGEGGALERAWSRFERAAWVGVLALMAYLISSPLLAGPKTGRIALLNEGGLDWHRPTFERIGAWRSGMFGLLPEYLESAGFEVDTLEVDRLLPGDLEGFDVLVTINNPRLWDAGERSALDGFLRSGGGLLVLGDHTDVFGLQQGFNSLLEEYGLRFRYDSAYHVVPNWPRCTLSTRHPLVHRARHAFALEHGIGASLECGPWVSRVVKAPYAFSDKGIPENVMGAFLGDYWYEPGELLGDLTLIASRTVGRGKLLVYGDTSAFQNGGIARAFADHLLPAFEWLLTEPRLVERPSGAILTLGVLLVFLSRAAARSAARGLWLPPAVAFVGVLWSFEAMLVRSAPPAPTPTRELAIVPMNSMPWTGHYRAGMNSIGPLYTNLHRAGFHVSEEACLQAGLARRPRIVALVAPSVPLKRREVQALEDFLEQGGLLLLALGYEERLAAKPLLERLGVALLPIPLGSIPRWSDDDGLRAEAPRLVDAWPISGYCAQSGLVPLEFLHPDSEVLFGWDSHVLAAFVPKGQGGTVLIADSRFFNAPNVEDVSGHWLGNIAFIERFLVRYAGALPSAVSDRFASPEKP